MPCSKLIVTHRRSRCGYSSILWIGEVRSREARSFFVNLNQYCQHIQVVNMDMNTSFDLEVQMHYPPSCQRRMKSGSSATWMEIFMPVDS
ncbi:hypothetical protein BVL39_28060 (plasmid) [Escherichia coli]|nr:hypothetical protein L282_24414 [Escherichia coli APEC IMT5155]AQU95345.1 hypothetical protein B1200_08480 [Escherichia coli]EFU56850.1 hypothetical protein HMPREF9545_03386 [Escherichia coli MS 16-3]EIA37863.1 hypothetical protein OQA_01833 [Escherichia coli SCI-07]EMD01362.1 hypothetical protein A364_25965 [Escherichia coli SEPT362]ESD37053.1 hypothetical protein HMPREF1604_03892 [Escherichia coli 908519]